MTGFPDFYASGGGFMHAVTAFGLLSILATLKGFAIFKWADRTRSETELRRTLGTAFDLGIATIGLGALGSCMGLLATGRMVEESGAQGDALVRVFAQTLSWTISPLVWALMLIIPVVVVGVILKRRGPSPRKLVGGGPKPSVAGCHGGFRSAFDQFCR